MPAAMRPDRCHVVLSTTLDGERIVANVDPDFPEAFGENEMGVLLHRLTYSTDVIIMVGNRRKVLTTPERKEAMLEFIRAEDEKVRAVNAGLVKLEEFLCKPPKS